MRHVHLKNPEAPGSEINHSNQMEAEAAGADATLEGSTEVDDIRAKLMARIDSDLAKQNTEAKSSDRLAHIAKRRRGRKPATSSPVVDAPVSDDPGFGPNLEMVSEPAVAEARPDIEADDEPNPDAEKASEILARVQARMKAVKDKSKQIVVKTKGNAGAQYSHSAPVVGEEDVYVFDASDRSQNEAPNAAQEEDKGGSQAPTNRYKRPTRLSAANRAPIGDGRLVTEVGDAEQRLSQDPAYLQMQEERLAADDAAELSSQISARRRNPARQGAKPETKQQRISRENAELKQAAADKGVELKSDHQPTDTEIAPGQVEKFRVRGEGEMRETEAVNQEIVEASAKVEKAENRFLASATAGSRKLAEAAGSLWSKLNGAAARQEAGKLGKDLAEIGAVLASDAVEKGGAWANRMAESAKNRAFGERPMVSSDDDEPDYAVSGYKGLLGSLAYGARDIAVENGKAWIMGGFAKNMYEGLRDAATGKQQRDIEEALKDLPDEAPEFEVAEAKVDEAKEESAAAAWSPQRESASEDLLRSTGSMFEVMGAQFEMPEGVGINIDVSKFDRQVAEAAKERHGVAAEEMEQIATEVGKAKQSWWEKSRVAIESYYDTLGAKLIDKLSRKKTLSPEVAAKVETEPPTHKETGTEKDWAAKRIEYNKETVRKIEDLLIDRRMNDALRQEFEASIEKLEAENKELLKLDLVRVSNEALDALTQEIEDVKAAG